MSDLCPHCRRPMEEPPPVHFTWGRWVEIFWSRVDRGGPDDCWYWLNARDDGGYGILSVPKAHRVRVGATKCGIERAHRVAWAIANRALPAGAFICHRCDNRRCVNPAHLYLGNHNENQNDIASRNRRAGGAR